MTRRSRPSARVGASLVIGALALGVPGTAAQEAAHGVPPTHAVGAETESARLFVEGARRAAESYRDPRRARAEGFRPLGPDFPGMGRHWVQLGRVVSGSLDPARPAVVCYIEVGDSLSLVGVAYAVPLGPGETPPDAPLGPDVWHDHVASLDEESLLIDSPATHEHHVEGFRLAMVHVWTEVDNPAGVLAQNNWLLPFVRLGLTTETQPTVAAARALSLADRGRSYYPELLGTAAALAPDETARVVRVVDAWAEHVEAWASGRLSEGGVVRGDGLRELEAVWDSLWRDLRQAVSDASWRRIAPLAVG